MTVSSQLFDRDRRRQIATLAAIIGSIAINTLSNIAPPNGVNIGQLSNTEFANVQITPANYAFAIWGLIYLGLIAFGLYQLQPTQRQNPRLRRCGYLLVLACLAQCIWIYLFLYRLFPLSILAMAGILVPLIVMYRRLEFDQPVTSRQERWLVRFPISIYLGWITVATVVNGAIALYSVNWNGWGLAPAIWTVIMMLISTAIAAFVRYRYQDPAYPGVTIWALVAIAIRQSQTPPIAITGIAAAIGLALFIVFTHRNTDKVELK